MEPNQLSTIKSNNAVDNIQLPGQSYFFKLSQVFMKTIKERSFITIAAMACFMSICSSQCLTIVFTLSFLVVFGCSDEYLLFETNRSCSMEVEHKMQFLSTIISEQQKSDDNVWDKIAKRMNVYLLERNVWASGVFFLDRADCEHFFERNFLSCLPSRNSS